MKKFNEPILVVSTMEISDVITSSVVDTCGAHCVNYSGDDEL